MVGTNEAIVGLVRPIRAGRASLNGERTSEPPISIVRHRTDSPPTCPKGRQASHRSAFVLPCLARDAATEAPMLEDEMRTIDGCPVEPDVWTRIASEDRIVSSTDGGVSV